MPADLRSSAEYSQGPVIPWMTCKKDTPYPGIMGRTRPQFPMENRLKNGEMLAIDRPSSSDAQLVLDYLEAVGSETDNLTFGPGELKLTLEQEAQFLDSLKATNLNFGIKGVLNGQLVSLLTFTRPTRARLKHIGEVGLAVLQKHWGKGIGFEMMNALLVWAKSNDVVKVELKVRSDNLAAIHLYKRLGFQEEGLRKGALHIHGKFFDELCMGLFLKQTETNQNSA